MVKVKGEVWVQFHVFTDSHEQMVSTLEAFKGTVTELGLPGVKLFYINNPTAEHKNFLEMLTLLQAQQNIFDAVTK